ncbi:MAG: MFS transporter [Lentisphaerae bacterium]|nr:MFS transporter [Lentisphaerota bacterium]MCP4100580.1 MFS transporter [Lentisphaerota bacterium]
MILGFCFCFNDSSIFRDFFQNASDAYLTDLTTLEERPMAYSIIRIGTNIGWGVGPMLGAFLARTPFTLLFGITATLLFAGGIFIAFTCPEVKGTVEKEPLNTPEFNWRYFLKDRRFLWFTISSFSLYFLMSQLYSVFSVFATGIGGINKDQLGVIYSINGLVVVFLQMPFTRILDRMKMTMMFRLGGGALVYFAGFMMVAVCSGFY